MFQKLKKEVNKYTYQDIMATTYDLAGVQKPITTYFNSLLPAILNKEYSSAYEEVYGAYMNLQRMVRTDKYKLIVLPVTKKLLLFDMENDPHEMNDLSSYSKYQEMLTDMKRRLIKQQKELGVQLDLSKILEI